MRNILVSITVLACLLAGCTSVERYPGLTYSLGERKENKEIIKRQSVADRTYVFTRLQIKYGHFQNYLNWWIDRPLYMDRSLRYPTGTFQHMIKDDFIKNTVAEAGSYEIDAFGKETSSEAGLKQYKQCLEFLKDSNNKNFKMVPDFSYDPDPVGKGYKLFNETIQAIVSSPSSLRINGKCLVSSYYTGKWEPGTISALLEKLRKENGDNWSFVSGYPVRLKGSTYEAYYQKDKKLFEESYNKFKDEVRKYLRVSDGIMFEEAGHLGVLHGKEYAQKFDEDFYRNCLIKAFLEVLAEPEFAGHKMLGLSAANGYINFLSGNNSCEEGTRTLRKSFEAARSAKPDFISMPEWNEVNENTCIQPTVLNSYSTRRIIRYYIRGLKGEQQAPFAGDNPDIPNLVVCSRCELKLGESMNIEILNVPDSDKTSGCAVRLVLKDVKGRVIKRFPVYNFKTSSLDDVTYSIPSEQFAGSDVNVVVPELEVTNAKGAKFVYANLRCIVLKPTATTNYKYAKQPLRDLFVPGNHDFEIKKLDNGKLMISGKIKSAEKLAFVEVMEGYREVYAFDKTREFDKARDFVILADFTADKDRILEGKITISGVSNLYTRPVEWPNSDFDDLKQKDNTILISRRINTLTRAFFIRIPREDVDRAVMDGELGGRKFQLPLKLLAERGSYAVSPDKQVFIRFRRMDAQPDIPPGIGEKEVAFNFEHAPLAKFPVYFVRVITESNKIWRSKPIMPYEPAGKKVKLNVWSETLDKVASVKVFKETVPDFTYDFDSSLGEILPCAAGAAYHAELGGGLRYSEPFNRKAPLPENSVKSAPEWTKAENGRPCLKFDKSNYITFPHETFPRGEFTLSFEIRPESGEDQVLFRHHGISIGSLTLILRKGELYGSFIDMELKMTEFKTGLKVPVGEWSKVEVAYDIKKMVFSVNSNVAGYPFSKRAYYFAPSVFGGHSKSYGGIQKSDAFFSGLLKSFRLSHKADDTLINSAAFTTNSP